MTQRPTKGERLRTLSAAIRNHGTCDVQHDDETYPRNSEILDSRAGILRCGHVFCKWHMKDAYVAPETLRRCPLCEEPVSHEYVLSESRNNRLKKRALGSGDMSLDPEADLESTSESSSESDSDSSGSHDYGRKTCFFHGRCSKERCPTCRKCTLCCGSHRRC
jgi:hypothetical protein